MEDEKNFEELKKFVEEQLWYIQTIAKENNINLEIVRSPLELQEKTLNARFWAMTDILEMMEDLKKQDAQEE